MTMDDRTPPVPDEPARPLTPREVDELLGVYAIGALDDDERAALDEHLARDPAARREAERLLAAFDEVVAAHAVAPPAALWDRIVAALPARDAGPSNAPPAAATVADELADRRRTRDDRRVPRGRLVAIASVAAALVLVAGIALGRTTSGPDGGDLAAQLRATATRAATQPGARQAVLSGTGGTARVVADRDGLAIIDAALARLDEGQSYQLWAVDGAAPVSLGLLGSASTVTVVHVGAASGLAITVEPVTGSTQPTSAPVVTGRLA